MTDRPKITAKPIVAGQIVAQDVSGQLPATVIPFPKQIPRCDRCGEEDYDLDEDGLCINCTPHCPECRGMGEVQTRVFDPTGDGLRECTECRGTGSK